MKVYTKPEVEAIKFVAVENITVTANDISNPFAFAAI